MLSTLKGVKFGSKTRALVSIFIGDWRRPLSHMNQSKLSRPQLDGPDDLEIMYLKFKKFSQIKRNLNDQHSGHIVPS